MAKRIALNPGMPGSVTKPRFSVSLNPGMPGSVTKPMPGSFCMAKRICYFSAWRSG